jgi:hypothetical protein
MAIVLVNTTGRTTDADAGTIAAVAASHTAGNLLVVCTGFFPDAAGNAVSSIADTAGNTFTYVASEMVQGFCASEIWYAKNILGHATNVVTITFNGNTQYRSIAVLQYSGCDTAAPYDVHQHGGSNSAVKSQSTTAIATNYDNEVIVASYQEYGATTFTAGANFTIEYTGSTYYIVEDRIVSSIASYGSALTLGTAQRYRAVHATFKMATVTWIPKVIGPF